MQPLQSCFLLLLFALPVFSEDCGRWERNASDTIPWRARIYYDGEFCYDGLVVSQNVVVSTIARGFGRGCKLLARSAEDGEGPIHAYLGKCYENHRKASCTHDSRGLVVKVLGVSRFKLTEDLEGVAWKTQRIAFFPNFVWPVCLVGRASASDLGLYAVSIYMDKFTDISLVPAEECLRTNSTVAWLQKQNATVSLLCVDNEILFDRRLLFNLHDGRHYWRGSNLLPYYSLPHVAYVDFLPFVRAIAQQVERFRTLPATPQPKAN